MSDRSRPYRLSPRAEIDLEDIWLYSFETWGKDQADKYHGEIVTAFEELGQGKRHVRPVLARAGYSKSLVGKHVIFFRNEPQSIDIIRILHQQMDEDRHL